MSRPESDPRADAARAARRRSIAYGVLSLLVAGATAGAAWWVVSGYEAQIRPEIAVEAADGQVLVASHELRPGHILGAEDLTYGPPPDGVSIEHLYQAKEALLGKTVGDRVLEGEALRPERLTAGGAALYVNEVLDPGSRAVTIKTSHAASVGGLLRPGFFVDVIVTMRPETKDLEAAWATETVLQGVRVVAVNDAVSTNPGLVDGSDTTPRTPGREAFVTLEVDPAEAEQLALASLRGQIVLSLRSLDDFDLLDPGGPLVTNALMGITPPVVKAQEKRLERKRVVAQRVEPDRTSIDVHRGQRHSVEEFDAEGRHLKTKK